MTRTFFVPKHSYGQMDTSAPVTQNLSQNNCRINCISNIKLVSSAAVWLQGVETTSAEEGTLLTSW